MICDSLTNAPTYQNLGPRISRGLEWLTHFGHSSEIGRHEIEGDNLFALVQSYETVAADQRKLESHRCYLDIQYVALGCETMIYAPIYGLTVCQNYSETNDLVLYQDPATSSPLVCAAGIFVIFYPQDAHKPGCIHGQAGPVRKVVIKVRL